MTKNDIEACHRLDDSRKIIVRFIDQKHSFETMKSKKYLCLLILAALS